MDILERILVKAKETTTCFVTMATFSTDIGNYTLFTS